MYVAVFRATARVAPTLSVGVFGRTRGPAPTVVIYDSCQGLQLVVILITKPLLQVAEVGELVVLPELVLGGIFFNPSAGGKGLAELLYLEVGRVCYIEHLGQFFAYGRLVVQRGLDQPLSYHLWN